MKSNNAYFKSMSDETRTIPVTDLETGMFIKLDVKWFKHPFARSEFKISSEKEIESIKKLGISKIEVDVTKSDSIDSFKPASGPYFDNEQYEANTEEDKKRLDHMQVKKDLLQASKNTYTRTKDEIENIFADTVINPEKGIEDSKKIISGISDQILEDPETLVHLMNLKFKQEFIQFHSLNVCVISLILGRALKLQKDEMRILGMCALFHDIGKRTLPKQLLHKKNTYSKMEDEIMRTHCQRGKEILLKAKNIPEEVITVAVQHHEFIDGSGYPLGLKEKDIDRFSKIVAVANTYETFTNPFNEEEMMLPHHALSFMYREIKGKLPVIMIELLVHSLGVYPPGSLVELNDGRIGIVISINKMATMRPTIMVFDRNVSKKEPVIIDLNEEKDFRIVKALSMSELSEEAMEYLEPGRRKGYSSLPKQLEE